MVPWANHEKVLLRLIMSFQQLVDFDWAVKVFLVPPAGNIQRRHSHAVQPRRESLTLPEIVIVRTVGEVAPAWELAVKVLRFNVRERAEFQIPLVGIKRVDDLRNIRHLL